MTALAKIVKTTASPRPALATAAAEEERKPERYGGERITEVVDQVGQKRDAKHHHVNRRLRRSRDREHRQTYGDGLDTRPRAEDRAIYEPVRVAVAVIVLICVSLARPKDAAGKYEVIAVPGTGFDVSAVDTHGR